MSKTQESMCKTGPTFPSANSRKLHKDQLYDAVLCTPVWHDLNMLLSSKELGILRMKKHTEGLKK